MGMAYAWKEQTKRERDVTARIGLTCDLDQGTGSRRGHLVHPETRLQAMYPCNAIDWHSQLDRLLGLQKTIVIASRTQTTQETRR
jgi:hypothetical protein